MYSPPSDVIHMDVVEPGVLRFEQLEQFVGIFGKLRPGTGPEQDQREKNQKCRGWMGSFIHDQLVNYYNRAATHTGTQSAGGCIVARG